MKDENIVSEQSKDVVQTVPLAYHEVCMERSKRTIVTMAIAWAASIIATVGIFAYMWLQYDYVSSTEYSGVYNVTDSEGNVLSSDLSPEDILAILEAIQDGKSSENTSPEA